ncbi:hypothetical protein EMIHUDRAFT_468946 [Emiliania huxleyi CCMP1516]|uniref:PPM-type phosphatase domain-containing protein n=2 Tax=Emiliania huxleyi TaxID=2903 RepID=A0A0D3JTL6_EMIH1|nr:hypothetical protein EMIHUDRAFT_468946 [Emiliania huxleyi CCMP1516]EOD26851.1 hypothetical protein EMIHUDRAFT_468946 [Emiliania huxleyi CCMP1516]|eukprot:XP_005779280.1 hypothetical protein EMIHUDRAFT_468946 [Emiliania huxleyi CCMP1516]
MAAVAPPPAPARPPSPIKPLKGGLKGDLPHCQSLKGEDRGPGRPPDKQILRDGTDPLPLSSSDTCSEGVSPLPLLLPPWTCECAEAQRDLKGEDCFDSRRLVWGGEEVVVMLVADGHGGGEASRHCRDHLLDCYLASAAGDPSAPSLLRAGVAACERMHEEVVGMTTAGSTITIVALNLARLELSVCNLGDSEAWLVPRSGSPSRLTEDHRLDSSEPERQRVRGMGGHLAHAKNRAGDPAGPLRLWPGGVAQARSVGDADVGRCENGKPSTGGPSLAVHSSLLYNRRTY